MVIVSIIMGLGITTLLRGSVNAVRAESLTTPSLLHWCWVAAILVQHVGLWSLRWFGEPREDWPFFVLLTFLLLPILYYAQAELLFPRTGREVHLTEYFIANRRAFFTLAILGFLGGALGPFVFYEGVDPFLGSDQRATLFFYLAMSVAAVAPLISKSVRLHTVWAAAYLVFSLGSFALLDIG